MYIECDHCSTGYELELPPAALSGGRSVKFRCTACGHSFHVVRDGTAVASSPRTEAASTASGAEAVAASAGKPDLPAAGTPSAGDETTAAGHPSEAHSATIQHVLLRQDGVSYHVPDVSTLQRWIVERRVLPSDELDFGGGKWVQAGDRPDLAPFFAIVSEVESVTRKLAAIAEPVAESPAPEEVDALGAYEAMPTETPPDAPDAQTPAVDLAAEGDPQPDAVAAESGGAATPHAAEHTSEGAAASEAVAEPAAADAPSNADLSHDEPDDLPPTEEASRAQVESLLAPRDPPRDMASMWDDAPSAEDGELPFDWSESAGASLQGESASGWTQPTAALGSEGPSMELADLIPRGTVEEDGPSAEDGAGPEAQPVEPVTSAGPAADAAPNRGLAEDATAVPSATPSTVEWPVRGGDGAAASPDAEDPAKAPSAELDPEDLFASAAGWPELDAPSSPLPKLAKTGEMIPFPGTERAAEGGAEGEEDEEVDENAWAEELFSEAPPPGSRPTLEVVEDEPEEGEEDEGLGLDDPSNADDETEEASSAAIEPEEAGWFAQGGDRVVQAEAVEPAPESSSGVWFFGAVVAVLILGLIWLAQGGSMGFGIAPAGDGADVAAAPNAAGDPAEGTAAGTPAPTASKSKAKAKAKATGKAPTEGTPAPAGDAQADAAPAEAPPPVREKAEAPKNPAPPPKAVTAGTFVRRGWGALDRKRYADAEKHFTEALKLRSGLGEAEYGLGYVAQQRGDTTSATRWMCAARGHAGTDVDLQREIDAGLTSMGASCP